MVKFIFSFTLFLYCIFAFGQYNWSNLDSAPYNGGKQDGIYFINKEIGWVVNGSGRIYKTTDGGETWIQQRNSPGTYFRSVAFVNEQTGFAGNIGPNYFPGVTDTNPLYKTIDGGNSWASVTPNISGVIPTGICAIQAVNANVIYAAGRVGTPTVIMKSTDGGNNWVGTDLSSQCKMILDIYFQTPEIGYVFAGTNANIATSKARILRTTDGGTTWTNVFTSTRNYEIFWKASFPSENVGFATIQSYNSATTQRFIVKTSDGGQTWTELPLANSGVREFGIGFINDNVGWVGGENNGYETLDGGLTWTSKDIGQYANKMSIVSNTDGSKTCYAVGLNVYKMETSNLSKPEVIQKKNNTLIYPNPAKSGGLVSIALDEIKSKITKAELIGIDGKSTGILFKNYFEGTRESPFMFYLPAVAEGEYIIKFTDEENIDYRQKILITK
jgi:photosystem II stability/assembly factor-like uncharacterized protein